MMPLVVRYAPTSVVLSQIVILIQEIPMKDKHCRAKIKAQTCALLELTQNKAIINQTLKSTVQKIDDRNKYQICMQLKDNIINLKRIKFHQFDTKCYICIVSYVDVTTLSEMRER